MLTIEYNPLKGKVLPDGEVEKFCLAAYQDTIGESGTIVVGNELICSCFRALVADGVIPHDLIQFKYGEKILPVDSDGRMNEYFPVDYNLNFLLRL